MPVLVLKNEATAARRRVYFHCVDVTNGLTAEVGEAGGQPELSVDGGGWNASDLSVLSAIGNGRYYADLIQAIVNADNAVIETRYKSANTAESIGTTIQVVKQFADVLADTGELQTNQGNFATATGFSTHAASDVVSAFGTGSDLTACATATGFSTHAASDVVSAFGNGSDLTTCATATGFSTHEASDVWAVGTRELTTPSSDFHAVPSDTWAAGTRTLTTPSSDFKASGFSTHAASDVVSAFGTGSDLTACATATGFSTHAASDVLTAFGTGSDLTACATATGFSTHAASDVWAVGTRTLTTPASDFHAVPSDIWAAAARTLTAAGLDAITVTEPTGVATNFAGMMVQLWRRFFKKSTLIATHLKTYKNDGSTVVTTQGTTDDGTTQTLGAAS